MKKILILSSILFTTLVNAQILKVDTVVMGPGYINDVYYNVFNAQKQEVTNTDWHLAFSTQNRSASIRINSGRGVKLYRVPNADITAFATFDTTNWKSFPELHDMNFNWNRDAFTSTAPGFSNPFDFGWGDYNQTSKHVVGDSLYIIVLPGGVVKKLAIDTLLYDSVFTFRYANIDNSDMKYGSVNRANYKNKLFIYQSLLSDLVLDKEPVDSTWQLKFTRYTELVPTGPGTFDWYPVIGALSNRAVEVVKASGVDTNAPFNPSMVFKKETNALGSDWKTFDNGTNAWVLEDSLVYFIRMNRKNTADSMVIAKIVFTGFGGAANGNIILNGGAMNTGLNSFTSNFTALGVYPNPAKTNANIIFNSIINDNNAAMIVYNMNGQQVFNNQVVVKNGINTLGLNTENIHSGLYIVKIETNTGSVSFKLIINE